LGEEDDEDEDEDSTENAGVEEEMPIEDTSTLDADESSLPIIGTITTDVFSYISCRTRSFRQRSTRTGHYTPNTKKEKM
jgi:hypothetical protein